MTDPLKPRKGGFLRPFGCGWFAREFLAGNSPYDSPRIDPKRGAPQSDIFYWYKMKLIEATARDKAVRYEEMQAYREGRAINPYEIEELTGKFFNQLPYKSKGCRYHSFVVCSPSAKMGHLVDIS